MKKGKVYVINGDLLKSECNVVVHQANCFATMGAGIAKQIARLYPAALDANRKYHLPVGSRERLGHTSHAWVDGPFSRVLVINLYGQHRYGKGLMTEYAAFKRGLHSILARIELLEAKNKTRYKIGLPFGVGCGYAGGDWSVVYDIIKDAAEKYGHDLYLYKI